MKAHTFALVGAGLLASVPDAAAICRVVESIGSAPPVIEPDQAVLFMKRENVSVGKDCPPPAEEPSDAGPEDSDAGSAPDAGPGATDAGPPEDGGLGDEPVCETIYGPAVTMVVQPRFRVSDEGASFALLMVTPRWPAIAAERTGFFRELAAVTAPETITKDVFVEDESLGYQCRDPKWTRDDDWDGCGLGSSSSPSFSPPSGLEPDEAPGQPQIDTVGAYEVARLQVSDTDELAAWLTEHEYVHDQADLDALAPYVAAEYVVVAVRVAQDGALRGGLTPLSFTWSGESLRLPLGISKQPAPAEAPLTVYVSAQERFDVPGAYVSYADRGFDGWFLTRNDMWADYSLGADADPTAVQGAGVVRDTVTVEKVIRIPSSKCPDRPDQDSGCACRARSKATAWLGLPILGALLLLGRRRRR